MLKTLTLHTNYSMTSFMRCLNVKLEKTKIDCLFFLHLYYSTMTNTLEQVQSYQPRPANPRFIACVRFLWGHV